MDGVAAVGLGVLHGGGDLAAVDVFQGLGHGLDVVFQACLGVIGKQCREGAGDVGGGNDGSRDVCTVGSGLGGIVGMMLGVPVCAVVYDEIRRSVRRKEAAAAKAPADTPPEQS